MSSIKGIKRHTLPSAFLPTGVVFLAGSSQVLGLCPPREFYLSGDEARESLKGENLRYSHMKSSPTFSPPPPLEHCQRVVITPRWQLPWFCPLVTPRWQMPSSIYDCPPCIMVIHTHICFLCLRVEPLSYSFFSSSPGLVEGLSCFWNN